MKIPPKYSITPQMTEFIAKIESQRLYLASFDLPKPVIEKIQRISLLKSSLYSARIEGNTLELADLEKEDAKSRRKLEVSNILDAMRYIDTRVSRGNINTGLLLKLHALTLNNISGDAGHLRVESSAIFNQAGFAVYVAPGPAQIKKLIKSLLSYINSDKEKFPLAAAFISHLVFEKTHPFLDGNGRVGRLLIAAILKAKGWDFTFCVPFEKYLDEHKEEYYSYLDTGLKDTNEYLLFMLKAFLYQIEEVRAQVEAEVGKKSLFLPPRQEEIYNIISDHKTVSFDSIKRRFTRVPQRTLRYDLKKLVDKGLVEKSGETRGRHYRVINKDKG